jgi:hypothetical protein
MFESFKVEMLKIYGFSERIILNINRINNSNFPTFKLFNKTKTFWLLNNSYNFEKITMQA